MRATTCASGVEIACNDDACANASGNLRASKITTTVASGTTYFIIVSGYAGDHGTFSLKVTAPVPATTTTTVVTTTTTTTAGGVGPTGPSGPTGGVGPTGPQANALTCVQQSTIDAAHLRTLFSAPVTLVPAPGGSIILLPQTAQYEFTAGSSPFSDLVGLQLVFPATNSLGGGIGFDGSVSVPTQADSPLFTDLRGHPILSSDALTLTTPYGADRTGGTGSSASVTVTYQRFDTATGLPLPCAGSAIVGPVGPTGAVGPTGPGGGPTGPTGPTGAAGAVCDLVGAPTCGTGCATVVANSGNCVGAVTTSTLASSVTVNWSGTRGQAPFCTCTDNSVASFCAVTSVSTSSVTFGLSAGLTGTINFHCLLGG